MKRLMAYLLSASLAVACLPFAAFAADPAEQTIEITEEEIQSEEEPVEDVTQDSAEDSESADIEINADAEDAESTESIAESYNITLDANGGFFEYEWDDVKNSFVETAEILNRTIPVGESITTVPAHEQESGTFTFLGWSCERDGSLIAEGNQGFVPVEDCVLYAVWEIETNTPDELVYENEESDSSSESAAEEAAPVQDEEAETGDLEIVDGDHPEYAEEPVILENDPAEEPENLNGQDDLTVPGNSASIETRDGTESSEGSENRESIESRDDSAVKEGGESSEGSALNADQGIPEAIAEDTVSVETVRESAANSAQSTVPTINATNIKLYALDESYLEKLTIPSGYAQKFQLKVTGYSSPQYEITSGDSVTIDSKGMIKPATETWYWNGNVGSTWPSGADGEVVTVEHIYGKSTIKVTAGSKTFTVTVTVYDYADTYAESVMNQYISQNITDDMEIMDRLDKIAAFPAMYDYDARYSGAVSMIIFGGGDCWASSDAILFMCRKLGMQARIRDASGEPGAGSGHRNVAVKIGEKTYILDAGYDGTAPRAYDVYEKENLFQYELNEDDTTIMITGYDGVDSRVVIPSQIDGHQVTRIANGAFWMASYITEAVIPEGVEGIGYGAFEYCHNLSSVTLPSTLKDIGQEAFSGCESLKQITIPPNVAGIYDYAFNQDEKLESVTFLGDKTTFIGESVFNGCSEDLIIYGPDGSYIHNYAKSNSIPFNAESLKNAVITTGTVSYTGKKLTPVPTVKLGTKTLKKGQDYSIAYKNNINAGTATITITGIGKYAGKKAASFKITKAAQSLSVKASASSVAVGGNITVSLTGNKGKKSFKSSNASIAAVNQEGKVTGKKIGTVTITVSSAATSNYNAASRTVTVKVVPAATSALTAENQAAGIKLTWKKVTGATGYLVYRGSTRIAAIKSGSTVTFMDKKANTNGTKYTFKVIPTASTGNGKAKSLVTYRIVRPTVASAINTSPRRIQVKWGRNAKATGYQVQCSLNKAFTSERRTATITNASTLSTIFTSFTKGKTYYVRMRTVKTVNGIRYYSTWSPIKSVKITK